MLVAWMQLLGCFVYSWPSSPRPSRSPNTSPRLRPRPSISPILCVWAVVMKLSLLAWLCFEIFIEVSHHKFVCIGEIAHVVAVLLDLTALALLPALLIVRSRLMCRMLLGLGDIPHQHGPNYMSRISQVIHGILSLTAFGLISWTYVYADMLNVFWKPIFALLNMFVVARVIVIVMFFRLLFHSLAGEILHETQQLADCSDPLHRDSGSLTQHNTDDHTHDDHHKHEDGGCHRVYEYLCNSKTNLEGNKCTPNEDIERDTPEDTWMKTQHLSEGHPSSGAEVNDTLLALKHLEEKIYVVSALKREGEGEEQET